MIVACVSCFNKVFKKFIYFSFVLLVSKCFLVWTRARKKAGRMWIALHGREICFQKYKNTGWKLRFCDTRWIKLKCWAPIILSEIFSLAGKYIYESDAVLLHVAPSQGSIQYWLVPQLCTRDSFCCPRCICVALLYVEVPCVLLVCPTVFVHRYILAMSRVLSHRLLALLSATNDNSTDYSCDDDEQDYNSSHNDTNDR